jgi:hypothetical protein
MDQQAKLNLEAGKEVWPALPGSSGRGQQLGPGVARSFGEIGDIGRGAGGEKGRMPAAWGASSILPLLADRERLREAILLMEILRRPEERWI